MARNKRKNKRSKSHVTARRPALSAAQGVRLQRAVHAQSTGNLALAESEYRALMNDRARTPELYCNLAAICAQTGRRSEAENLWSKALELAPTFLEARMNLAQSYQQAGDLERAAEAYRRVIAAHKSFVPARYMLGNLLKSQGKLEEASACYEQVMAQQPDYTQAHFTYSGIHRYESAADPHLVRMLELYQTGGFGPEGRIHLAFALAKAFEDINDYGQAFAYLEVGNGLRAAAFDYSIDGDRALIDSIIRSFSKEAMSRVRINAEPSSRPIFIVGMPRSGTSLVEKIIASHSGVRGAGELDYLFALGTSLFLSGSDRFEFRPLESYAPDAFETLGRTYLEKIALLDSEAGHVTDKMPFNMMMIGLIRIALPNARIIHCARDARDTCLSIFKQNFTTGNYRFAYDLKTVAQFYNCYSKLMRHWHDCLPGDIYDVSYKALTQNPEQEIRKLLSACDLDFEEACLAFEKTDAVVTTASAYQVRQPMYTSSVGLWEKYREFLGPMLDELQGGDPD